MTAKVNILTLNLHNDVQVLYYNTTSSGYPMDGYLHAARLYLSISL